MNARLSLDLEHKNIKSTVVKMFKKLKKTLSKELKECMRILSHQIKNFNKEIQIIKENKPTRSSGVEK